MFGKWIYVLLASIVTVYSKNVHHRSPRYIGGAYTKTVTSTQVVTSLVPSSCVYVDPTLPPCRSVRFLNFPHFDTVRNWFDNKSATLVARSETTETTPLGWGEYFGFYHPTVTITEIQLKTSIVQDPRIAVTYAVKGCRPQKFPGDIDSCQIETSTIPILEILPTSTVAISHTTSVSNNRTQPLEGKEKTLPRPLNATKEITTNTLPVIESSSIDETDMKITSTSQEPTEPLHI